MFFKVLVWLGGIGAFTFITLSLACGLYYLAELVEEYTVLTKKIIKNTTYVKETRLSFLKKVSL